MFFYAQYILSTQSNNTIEHLFLYYLTNNNFDDLDKSMIVSTSDNWSNTIKTLGITFYTTSLKNNFLIYKNTPTIENLKLFFQSLYDYNLKISIESKYIPFLSFVSENWKINIIEEINQTLDTTSLDDDIFKSNVNTGGFFYFLNIILVLAMFFFHIFFSFLIRYYKIQQGVLTIYKNLTEDIEVEEHLKLKNNFFFLLCLFGLNLWIFILSIKYIPSIPYSILSLAFLSIFFLIIYCAVIITQYLTFKYQLKFSLYNFLFYNIQRYLYINFFSFLFAVCCNAIAFFIYIHYIINLNFWFGFVYFLLFLLSVLGFSHSMFKKNPHINKNILSMPL